ncbi:MAG TPA: ATP-binding protein [Microvirga sp.]|nr:ATP-binding protein [Microvirga sp.]
MDWLDGWLAARIHPSVRANAADRPWHERFVIARLATLAAALAAAPLYLLKGSAPGAIELLALAALAAPLAALWRLARTGRLVEAQGLVSAGLTLFGAGLAATFGPAPEALLGLLLVPLEALFSGSRRAFGASLVLAFLGLPLAVGLRAAGLPQDPALALGAGLLVALAVLVGHASACFALEARTRKALADAHRGIETGDAAALDAFPDLVTWHDRNGSVLRANAAARRLVGAPAASLQGRGLFGRIDVADRPAFLKAISDAATASEPVAVELRLQAGEAVEAPFEAASAAGRPGSKHGAALTVVEMRAHRLGADPEGAVVIAAMRDVTGQRRREEELEGLHRAALAAAEARARLLCTVSHELRTPLNAIIGYAELLMGRGPDPRPEAAGEYAAIIHEAGHLMHGVVSTLLDLATIEAGRHDLAPEALDVAELVRQSCRPLALMAERAGIAIAQDVADGLPPLQADRHACQQILLNLLSNAVKFTPAGGLVTVQARREGDRLALRVRDTGIGVLPSELPHLGDPFYRAASARERGETGTGLGLAVVRGLVALHQGRLSIAPAPAGGLDVTVSLPFEAPRPRLPAEAAQPIPLHPARDGSRRAEPGRPCRAAPPETLDDNRMISRA